MASANFDALHLRLSRVVDDPVAAAGTDGAELTSALRTEYLNRANRKIQAIVWGAGVDKVERFLQGLVTIDTTATSSGSKAVPSDYSYWLGFQKVSGGRATFVPPEAKPDLDNDSNPNLTLAFTVVGSTVYAYENGAAISNAAHPFYYIRDDQRASSGDTSDILIDAIWYDVIVDLAASYHFMDKGDAGPAASFTARAFETIQSILR